MNINEMFRLEGQIAIVTGGAGIYGTDISEALCEAGATVIIASRQIAQCEQLAEQLCKEGYKAIGMELDLSKEESIYALAQQVIDRYGRIDILVNNAVSRYGLKDIEETTAEGWLTAQQVNGLGVMLLTKEAVKQMKNQGKGNIINISSIQGVLGPNFPVYGESDMTSGIEYTYAKWGMIGMTKWLANYYGKYQIRVNAISPGGYNPVGTDMEIKNEEFLKKYKELTIIIDKQAKDVPIEEALGYVFGYTIANDLSARDLQTRTQQWLLGKSCDGVAQLFPYGFGEILLSIPA